MFTHEYASAQNYWIGGTTGAETAWDNPNNWSKNHIPDWTDSEVIIPNVNSRSRFYPIVNSEVPVIPYLVIEDGAKLTIAKTGALYIDGGAIYNHGVYNIGKLINSGTLLVKNTTQTALFSPSGIVKNTGTLVADNYKGNSIAAIKR